MKLLPENLRYHFFLSKSKARIWSFNSGKSFKLRLEELSIEKLFESFDRNTQENT